MFPNSSFYEVKALQQPHYSSPNCCAHVCTTIIAILYLGEFPVCYGMY
jgi:hypothetical protein